MATSARYHIPVVVQNLPDLKYSDDDWISKEGRQVAIGSIAVSVLDELFQVDRLTPENAEGYQRVPTQNRVNSLKRDLKACEVDLPTAILLNFREFDRTEHIDESTQKAELILHSKDRLYVVDGQHRVEALISLYKEASEEWGSYSVPFVCLLGADRHGEMTEFFVVNDNAKSIGTSLAYELLTRRAQSSEAVKNHLIETGKGWLKAAGSLTHRVSETDIWQRKIQFPGQAKRGTLITNNGMMTSLRPLLEQPGYFQSIANEDQQLNVLNTYWKGIKLVVPEVMNDPQAYNLQRTLGVSALHAVLVNVLAIMGSKGLSVLDPDEYAEIMKKIVQRTWWI